LEAGDGGKVMVWSDGGTFAHGNIFAEGGVEGGNGGLVETSGHYLNVDDITVSTAAANGLTGTWLLDPVNITITAAPPTNNMTTTGTTWRPTKGSVPSSTLL